MNTPRRRGMLVLLWSVLLIAPVAWTVALGAMLPMTDWVCTHGGRHLFLVIGGACLLMALVALGLGTVGLRRRFDTALRIEERAPPVQDPQSAGERSHFMLQLGMWMSALFALVLLFYLIPVFLLSPCPA